VLSPVLRLLSPGCIVENRFALLFTLIPQLPMRIQTAVTPREELIQQLEHLKDNEVVRLLDYAKRLNGNGHSTENGSRSPLIQDFYAVLDLWNHPAEDLAWEHL
jgi:hypothetical protein